MPPILLSGPAAMLWYRPRRGAPSRVLRRINPALVSTSLDEQYPVERTAAELVLHERDRDEGSKVRCNTLVELVETRRQR
jgi:hypothetical protein